MLRSVSKVELCGLMVARWGLLFLVMLGVRFGEGEALVHSGLGLRLVPAKVLDVSQCLTSKGLWRRRHLQL